MSASAYDAELAPALGSDEQVQATEPPAPASDTTASLYRYRALKPDGSIMDGQLNAGSEADVLTRLRMLGLRAVTIETARSSVLERDFSIPGFGQRVKAAELAVVARQFATMTRAGVPLLRALEVLRQQAVNPLIEETLQTVRNDVEAGTSLSDAVGRHPKVFDRLTTSLIRAGEAAGALDVVLGQIADTLERGAAMRQKIRSALMYPTAVLIMVVGVVIAMLTFVIPTFAGIYDDLGGTLPLPTRILVTASEQFTARFPYIVLVAIAAGWGLKRWLKTPEGRLKWDGWKLQLPLVGNLLAKSGMARIGRTMAVLTRSGVPVLETLRITSETVGNARLSRALDQTRNGVRRGESLAENLAVEPLFPTMVIQLVTVGEETGTLDEVMENIGASSEEEVETAVSGFAALIEPLLMAVIGVVVGGMVVALYLPMFRVIDLVQ
jgi:type IV pilus assembly protein PilC